MKKRNAMEYEEIDKKLDIMITAADDLGDFDMCQTLKEAGTAVRFRIKLKPFRLKRKFRKDKYTCGYCGAYIGEGKGCQTLKYCSQCGQAIKWDGGYIDEHS